MEAFMAWLKSVNDVVWGPGMLVLLVGTGLYLTVGLKFFTFRNFFRGLKNLWAGRSNQSEQGEISPFNALMTALAADIGTGNIVGVSTAIYIGGPGALFWMWVTALVGMATKFSEVLLSVHFREKTPAGNWVGGAMYFIKNGLGPKWMWLGSCFALFGIVACIGTGAMVQGNSIGEAIQANLSIPTWFTAVAVFLLAGAVLIGGVKRIGAVAGKVVPAMAVIYVLISLIVIILHIDQLPRVLAWVVAEAFTPTAAEGGFAGATVMMAIRMGMARGVFSNEAGLGTAPMAHAAATSASPLVQIGIASSAGKSWIHSAGKTRKAPWGNTSQEAFTESMAEAAKSVIDYEGEKILYISVMNNLSVDCDCVSTPAAPKMKNVGILASLDPVALDQACVDLVLNSPDDGNKDLVERITSRRGTHILYHAALLGAGSRNYQLIDLDHE